METLAESRARRAASRERVKKLLARPDVLDIQAGEYQGMGQGRRSGTDPVAYYEGKIPIRSTDLDHWYNNGDVL